VLTRESMEYYDYRMTNIVMIDDNPHYIIEFQQKPDIKMPLFLGKDVHRLKELRNKRGGVQS
jgi:hypothetical protein